MIKNRKLTLEQRVTRLENAIKANRCGMKHKFEGGPVNDNLLRDMKELKARLKMKGVYDPKVEIDGQEIVVTLDWDYFGITHFAVMSTAKGYRVEDDFGEVENFATLDSIAKYIADKDYEAAMDL